MYLLVLRVYTAFPLSTVRGELQGAGAFPGSGHLTPLEEENRTLRADVKRLEMERDILKKATAFFAALTK